ncbi:hypothetical protein AB0B45_36480 [Nonomuraea sp. NPDC049152]|uniref:hypothetical protein n=1 Tax=Nonomuraea sp. NPDC049152 TaxID=3154350 RepID=UPI00340D962B
MFESELRQAMAEDSAHLAAASDLVDQVVLLSRRRRRTRHRVVAVVAAVALALAGWVLVPRDEQQVATTPSTTGSLDDVEVRHVPAGLGKPVQGSSGDGALLAGTLTWSSGDDLVRVSRYGRTGDPDTRGLMVGTTWTSIRGRTARISDDGRDLLWAERPGLLLRVTVGANHIDEVRTIAEELLMTDPTGPAGGVVEGMRVSYLPPRVHLAGVMKRSDGETAKTWTGAGDRRITLISVRGEHAASLDELAAWSAGEWGNGTRTTVNGKPGYRDGPGSLMVGHGRLWLQKPGLGLVLKVSDNLVPEIDRILAGITPMISTPGLPESFEGLTVTHLPPGLTRTGDAGMDGLGKWWNRDGSSVMVEVVRGERARTLNNLADVSWDTSERFTRLKKTTVGSFPALVSDVVTGEGGPRSRMVLWTVRPGYGVRVQVSDDLVNDLMAVARGIRVAEVKQRGDQELDGIGIDTLGMTRASTTAGLEEDSSVTTGVWRSGGDELRVEVHRGRLDAGDWVKDRLGVRVAGVTEVGPGDRIRAVVPGGRREVWRVDWGLAVVVTASRDIDRVTKSLRVTEVRSEPRVPQRDPSVKPVNGTTCDARSATLPPSGEALSERQAVRGVWFIGRPEGAPMAESFPLGESFSAFDGLVTKGRVYGYTWIRTGTSDRLTVGVVCGVRTLDGMVKGAEPAVLRGRPAITWSRGDYTYAMWLERPGVAVFGGGNSEEGLPQLDVW